MEYSFKIKTNKNSPNEYISFVVTLAENSVPSIMRVENFVNFPYLLLDAPLRVIAYEWLKKHKIFTNGYEAEILSIDTAFGEFLTNRTGFRTIQTVEVINFLAHIKQITRELEEQFLANENENLYKLYYTSKNTSLVLNLVSRNARPVFSLNSVNTNSTHAIGMTFTDDDTEISYTIISIKNETDVFAYNHRTESVEQVDFTKINVSYLSYLSSGGDGGTANGFQIAPLGAQKVNQALSAGHGAKIQAKDIDSTVLPFALPFDDISHYLIFKGKVIAVADDPYSTPFVYLGEYFVKFMERFGESDCVTIHDSYKYLVHYYLSSGRTIVYEAFADGRNEVHNVCRPITLQSIRKKGSACDEGSASFYKYVGIITEGYHQYQDTATDYFIVDLVLAAITKWLCGGTNLTTRNIKDFLNDPPISCVPEITGFIKNYSKAKLVKENFPESEFPYGIDEDFFQSLLHKTSDINAFAESIYKVYNKEDFNTLEKLYQEYTEILS